MTIKMPSTKKFLLPACRILLVAFVLAGGAAAGAAKAGDASDKSISSGQQEAAAGDRAASSEEKSDKPAEATADPNRLIRKGLVVDFEARPVGGPAEQGLMQGHLAEVRFTITEVGTGKPIKGIIPGAWMDIGKVLQGQADAEQKSCKEKIGLYLRGAIGIRPMIDLNSYYVLVLNQEPSISVVDPLVSMVGVTSTLGTIPLKSAGVDWVTSVDRSRLYVSMPQAGAVAVVDTAAFKVLKTIEAGAAPTRVALQPDGRYLWVGNDGKDESESGVTIIDVDKLEAVESIATGAGHHEIAFSDDSRYAFVSNRDGGTVSVIDVPSLKKVKDLATGPMPIALAYSPLAQALYVADGKAGTIAAVHGRRFEVVTRISAKPGLGPMRFTPDGRLALVVNPAEDTVTVIDAADNTLVHTIAVRGQPYQITLSRAFAYVRVLDSERVSMINLTSLGRGKQPIVQSFQAGAVAPKLAEDLPLADSIASTTNEAAVFVVNPADNTTYFYMEGMNAPASNYKVYGARARAVTVVERSLQEVQPGVYAAKVKIPAPGKYDVAFLLETPEILHCFAVEAKPDPLIKSDLAALDIEYPASQRTVQAGGSVPLRFTLRDPATGKPRLGLADVRVLFFRVPGRGRTEVFAREVGDGVYQAMLPIVKPGAYYIHVAVPSAQLGYADLPNFTMVATKAKPAPPAKPTTGG